MRTRNPANLDRIVTAATVEFIERGFRGTKIYRVAERARVGPGTIYLYVEDKEALFELVLRRALEDPSVAHPSLPFMKSSERQQLAGIAQGLTTISHFPQLWVASQRRQISDAAREYEGILRELFRWLHRYRDAILLVDGRRLDRPELRQLFDRIVWRDLTRRLTDYVSTRVRTGHFEPEGDPALLARFLLDSLLAFVVTGPVTQPSAQANEEAENTVVRLLARAARPEKQAAEGALSQGSGHGSVAGSSHGFPLPAEPGY